MIPLTTSGGVASDLETTPEPNAGSSKLYVEAASFVLGKADNGAYRVPWRARYQALIAMSTGSAFSVGISNPATDLGAQLVHSTQNVALVSSLGLLIAIQQMVGAMKGEDGRHGIIDTTDGYLGRLFFLLMWTAVVGIFLALSSAVLINLLIGQCSKHEARLLGEVGRSNSFAPIFNLYVGVGCLMLGFFIWILIQTLNLANPSTGPRSRFIITLLLALAIGGLLALSTALKMIDFIALMHAARYRFDPHPTIKKMKNAVERGTKRTYLQRLADRLLLTTTGIALRESKTHVPENRAVMMHKIFLTLSAEEVWVALAEYLKLDAGRANLEAFKQYLVVAHDTDDTQRDLSYETNTCAEHLFKARMMQKLQQDHVALIKKLRDSSDAHPELANYPTFVNYMASPVNVIHDVRSTGEY